MNQEKNIRNRIFATELKRLMDESVSGVTQAKLAEICGVTQPTIYRYLQGQVPKASELMKLARFFDVLPEQLLNGGAKRGSLAKKWIEENRKPGEEFWVGPSTPITPHPIYTSLSQLSAQMMTVQQEMDDHLAGMDGARKKLAKMQAKLSEIMQRAAELE